MFPRHLSFTLVGLALSTLTVAPAARAHIRLLDPVARYDITGFDTGIKSCPCGLGGSNRTCNLATDASDPDRSTRVRRAEAGSTITLRFEEYVDHSGTFRVAFDPEGADFADFNSNILVPMVPDPPGGAGNVGEGDVWEIDVQLPDVTCSNCTLQLIQAMNGDMVNPVTDPTRISTYYACVDLELVAPGTMGGAGGADEPGASEPDPMGAADDPMAPNADPTGSDDGATGASGGSMGSSGSSTGSNLGSAPAMAADTTSNGAVAMVGMGNVAAPAGMGSQSPGGLINLPAQSSDDSAAASNGCSLGTPRHTGGAVLAVTGLLAVLAAGGSVRRRSAARR